MTTPIDELAGLARAEHLIANYLFNEDGESEEWLTEALELVQAALAHAAPERLDVMALTEAIYAVNWLTPDPKPTRASSWRWARAEVLARKIAARLSQPDATEGGPCVGCGEITRSRTDDGRWKHVGCPDATEEAGR